MNRDELPTCLIYGLIDPRTLLIRYVGLSSSGLKRPKHHRYRSCPDSYCRRWVKSLQHLGLDYEITVLEAVRDAVELAEAERRWIVFGRACGWPLTNVTAGGYPSEAVIVERGRRKAARKAARSTAKADHIEETILKRQRNRAAWEAESEARALAFYSTAGIRPPQHFLKAPHGIPAEIERRCLQFFDENVTSGGDLISAVIAKACVTRETATQLYAKWRSAQDSEAARRVAVEDLAAARRAAAEVQDLCFQLFEKYLGHSDNLIVDVAAEAAVSYAAAACLYKKWLIISKHRGKRALREDRERLINSLRGGAQDIFSTTGDPAQRVSSS